MKMKLLIFGIVLLALLFGCIDINDFVAEDLSDFTNCGSDTDCLEAKVPKCEKAYATVTEEDSTMEMTYSAYIMGKENNMCNIKIKIDKVELPPGVDPLTLVFVTSLQGKEMTCVYPIGDTTLIDEGLNKDFFAIDNCEGSLVDHMNSLKAMAGE